MLYLKKASLDKGGLLIILFHEEHLMNIHKIVPHGTILIYFTLFRLDIVIYDSLLILWDPYYICKHTVLNASL